jgi:hypothetical protein
MVLLVSFLLIRSDVNVDPTVSQISAGFWWTGRM